MLDNTVEILLSYSRQDRRRFTTAVCREGSLSCGVKISDQAAQDTNVGSRWAAEFLVDPAEVLLIRRRSC